MMTLKDNQLFRGLSDNEVSVIIPMIKIRSYKKGAVLIEEGQTDKTLFVLIKGKVEVLKTAPDGKTILIAHRESGDFFGEMALLEDAPRSARIVATEPCEAGLIDDIAFNMMLDIEPKIAVNLLKTISMRLRMTNEQIIEQFSHREAEQKKQIERLHQLVEICKSITANFDKTHLLSYIPRAIRGQISCDKAYVALIDDVSQQMIISEGVRDEVKIIPLSMNPFAGFVNHSKIQRLSGTENFVTLNLPDSEFLWNNCGGLLLIPLSAFDHFDGWIILKRLQNTPWDEHDLAFLETLASYVVIALQNIRLSAQIVVSEKLSAVGRASSSIIHDFKNLMSVVHIYAQMILKSHGPDDTKELVDKILTSSHLMITMSKEILTFARGEIILNRETIAVDRLIRSVVSLIEIELSKRGIELTLDIPADHQYNFDSEKMSRVVYNLLKNAAESIEKEGGSIRVNSVISDHELILTISDNGKGIPEKMLQTMFTPFVTNKPDGTGLGMLIVKNIIDAHGGQIDIESREGQGTDILLSFPLS